MENQAGEQSYEDVQKSGYLRKHKSMHRRFFVLRAASELGPARLEYYENEKKFRSKSPVPKKSLNLEACFNINKRADSKNKHMIVLYTRSESFAIAADTEEVQDEWYQAMLDLHCNFKTPDDWGSSGECSSPSPIPTFKEVWQVKVWPKGLGHARNLVGIYRLCLTDKTVNFVKLNSEVASVVLQLMNVRRCGHSENFFFIEVGRSAVTGPGEFWMQVEDSVVAQHMHETLLEAMKALSEEFRQRSKSQSVGTSCGGTASNPISAPSRRHHPNLPPSQVGFSRRARTETPGTGGSSTSTSPTSRHGFPRARTASIGARSEEGGACGKGTDYGSSDEYGSSPGEHSLMVPNLPGTSHGMSSHLGHGEGPASYIVMGQREGLLASGHRSKGRRILRRSSNRECEAERRLLSKRASLPSATHDRLGPHRKDEDEEDDDEYAIMCRSPNNTVDRQPASGGGVQAGAGQAQGLAEARKRANRVTGDVEARGPTESGYMSMLPGGVTSPPGSLPLSVGAPDSGGKASAGDEYMAMTPNNSVSSPQPIRQPGSEGYMLMSPNSGSSDLQWDSRSSVESRPTGDYMNISPISSRSACSTPPSHPEQHPLQPKMFNSYFSLPRAYQHTLYTRFEDDLSQGKGKEGSDVSKANTLPRAKENLQPSVSQNVGDYVSIAFGEDGEYGVQRPSRSRHGQAVVHGPLDRTVLCRDGPTNLSRSFSAPLATSAEYISMDVGKSSSPRTPFRSKFSTPTATLPAIAPKSRDSRSSRSSPLAAESHAGYRTSAYVPTDTPDQCPANVTARAPAHSGQPPFRPDASLGFSPIDSSPGRSGRPARGDSQGLRSHCPDEAFGPPPSPSSSTSLFPEAVQAVARRPGRDRSSWESGQGAGSAALTPQAASFSGEPGLNYIDLDLALTDSPPSGAEHVAAPYNMAASGLGSTAGTGLNTYASIDFYKSEELRAHQTSRKDIQAFS
ncbi:hypothetical protein NHX12_010766 [Muraenolepis orangiensis]|uniref:Insulin receptor substrate 1 n=1 Tax=Muraenolepis orangiensis TaxID=630683 RepID=A0A9Q0DKE9_9TELE|nr:hypothetical protein NHX12_010766 [Muraenolepis orangiensis]